MTNATVNATVDFRNHYGATETNGLVNGAEYHGSMVGTMTLRELDDANGKIERVRILTGQGIWDFSYITGILPNGDMVRVHMGNLPSGLRKWEVKRELIAWAKSQNVYGKGIGLLDTEGIWSVSR